jgi:hypothetical protein
MFFRGAALHINMGHQSFFKYITHNFNDVELKICTRVHRHLRYQLQLF